jgi:hypothetical protein
MNTQQDQQAWEDLQKAIACLKVELPMSIVNDIKIKFNRVKTLAALQRSVGEATDTAYDHLPKEHLIKIIYKLSAALNAVEQTDWNPETMNESSSSSPTGAGWISVEDRDYTKFFTPQGTAAFMASLLEAKAGDWVLEPSAGAGALVRAVKNKDSRIVVTAVEQNEKWRAYLKSAGANLVVIKDFLAIPDIAKWTSCIANPPFGNGTDLKAHIDHMRRCVKTGGTVVVLVPEDFELDIPHETYPHDNWSQNSDGTITPIKIIKFANTPPTAGGETITTEQADLSKCDAENGNCPRPEWLCCQYNKSEPLGGTVEAEKGETYVKVLELLAKHNMEDATKIAKAIYLDFSEESQPAAAVSDEQLQKEAATLYPFFDQPLTKWGKMHDYDMKLLRQGYITGRKYAAPTQDKK